jgi:hypothetical protein
MGFFGDVAEVYRREIIDSGRQPQLLLLLAFLVTFLIVRLITHSIRAGRFGFRNVEVGGRHFHHMVPGIILLLVTGYLGIALDPGARDVLAVLFGIGAALTLDEFALWLNLEDVYWSREGRTSIDAVVVFGTIAGLIALGVGFWLEVARLIGQVLTP